MSLWDAKKRRRIKSNGVTPAILGLACGICCLRVSEDRKRQVGRLPLGILGTNSVGEGGGGCVEAALDHSPSRPDATPQASV